MKKLILVTLSALLLATTLFLLSACGDGTDNRTLFERFGNGLDTLSSEGATDLWDMSVTKGGDTVTVLESFYNESSIYIGFKLEGEELINNSPAHSFYYDGEMIGHGGHGGLMDEGDIQKTWTQYRVMQPSWDADIEALPDEFTLEFVVEETIGPERTFEFEIPLKRSDREVIRP